MFFQLTILEHLEAMGYIESGSKEDAVSRIIQYKEEVRADMLYPPVQGEFYEVRCLVSHIRYSLT